MCKMKAPTLSQAGSKVQVELEVHKFKLRVSRHSGWKKFKFFCQRASELDSGCIDFCIILYPLLE